MGLLGARLAEVEAGRVVIELPFRADLTQQDGFLHAGITTAVVDSACGLCGAEVLSVEFKVNLLSPAAGHRTSALKSGRTLTVCQGELTNETGKVLAVMTATMIAR